MAAQLTDVVLSMALFYSAIDLVMQWDQYELCSEPLHWWMTTSFVFALGYRYLQGRHETNSSTSLDDLLFELAYHQRGASTTPVSSTRAFVPIACVMQAFTENYVLYGVGLPVIISWTIVGTRWFRNVVQDSPECLPDDHQAWFFVLWMSTCYFIIFFEFLRLGVSTLLQFKMHLITRQMTQTDTTEIMRRWGPFYGSIHVTGIKPESLSKIPSPLAETEADEPCSICLQDLTPGERLRALPQCRHQFHQACADLWLLRRNNCPLCKTEVLAESR